MCGIAGSYRGSSPEHVQRMVERLRHRGPDGAGTTDTAAGSLGHTRLAILDIAGGHQPLGDGRTWISFNGEIYNHQDLRRRYLGDRALRTRTDTEVILHLYALLGPQCVTHLDGMFAFAIISGGELFLARDPLGIKPLYVGAHGATLYFASEIKALAEVTDDIHEFPPGCWCHSAHGETRYYTISAAQASEPVATEAQACDAIRTTLGAAVQKRLMADVPVGISLSGGLDSSIVALLAREGLERLDTFAVGVAGSDDLAAAREMARFLGTRHHELVYTANDVLSALPEVIYYLESCDPALVRSAVANYFLARLASDHVKVFLTGEGADELYAGYAYLSAIREPTTLHAELMRITGALHNTNLQRADRMSMAYGLEARVPFLDSGSVALALGLPAAWKLCGPDRPEKTLLRQAFADRLPAAIASRPKQKYAAGAGSANIMATLAEVRVSDAEFARERERLQARWNYRLANKEALHYYQVMRQFYRDEWILPEMGQSRSLHQHDSCFKRVRQRGL
jgi:asparagine synthase (glutamine-hydrolysing)